MPFEQRIAIYCDSYTEHINAEISDVKVGGTYGYHLCFKRLKCALC